MTYKELFNGKCPYTGIPCDKWDCLECEVEKEEREWMEEDESNIGN